MEELLIKGFYLACLLGVTIIGILIKRVYNSIDLLFHKYDSMAKEVHRMQLAIVGLDPSKTAVFKSFMLKDDT